MEVRMEGALRLATTSVILTCLFYSTAVSTELCSGGFMESGVLAKRARKISSDSEPFKWLDGELRVIPEWNFTCNTTITGLLLGADIQTGKNKYPEVQIWRISGSEFIMVASRWIVLSPGNFTASGVFLYHLTPPLPVVAGDMLGVYQSHKHSSAVRLYYIIKDPDAPESFRVRQDQSPTSFSIDRGRIQGHYIPISVITSDSQCSENFITFNILKQKAIDANVYNVITRPRQLRIFPEISFRCSGNLTKWIVGGEIGENLGAELQIWRRQINGGQTSYALVGSSVLQATPTEFVGVYTHTPNPPLEFQEGDVLGVYQQGGNGRVRVYYQETTGPANYRSKQNTDPPLGLSTLADGNLSAVGYDYPLVTVEIEQSVSSTPTLHAVTEFQQPSRLPELSVSSSPVTIETGMSVLIATSVSVVMALMVIIIIVSVVTVSIFIWWKRQGHTAHIVELPAKSKLMDLQENMCYDSLSKNMQQDNTEHQDPSMELQENACYKDTYYVGEDSEQSNECNAPVYAEIGP